MKTTLPAALLFLGTAASVAQWAPERESDHERTTAYRDSSGPDSRSGAHCATIVCDWEEPSGDSRYRSLGGATVVPFPQIWMSSGECRLKGSKP